MKAKETIIKLITERIYIPASITENSNLYKDLGFDSLSFISLLADIEDLHDITFDITEMEACLQLEHLIEVVEDKINEKGERL